MPTIKLSKKELLKGIGKNLSDEALKDRICFLGTNLENMDKDDVDIEVFPNRPDLLSNQGFARALASFVGNKTGLRNYIVKKSNDKVIIEPSVRDVRPFTACAVVKNIKFSDEKIKEIITIQEKLHVTFGRNRKKVAIGIYPLEHIKFPIRFKAMKPEEIVFKPLDLNKDLNAAQILAIHPTGREYGYLLEGKSKYPVFIDAKNNIMSMPPIINSNTVGKISEKTRDVFIECSGFDFDYLNKCLNMIVTALGDMGGIIYSLDLNYSGKKYTTPNLNPKEMKIDIEYVNKMLGLDIKENDLKKLLEKMGYGYKNKKALVPCYRADILHQIDIVEDIAIAYGYENFKEVIPNVSTIGQENRFEIFKNKIREILVGFGFIEVKNFHLTSRDSQTKLMNTNLELVELENSLVEYNILRNWLIPSVLDTLKSNKHHEYPQNIFEVGTIFKINKETETGVLETDRVCVALCGQDVDYTKIKQVYDALMHALNVNYEINEVEHHSFIKGRVARMIVNNEKVAFVGELHPSILANFDIDMPTAVLELNLDILFNFVH